MSDRTEFIDAAKAQAWTVADPESQDHGRTLVHCRGGFTGADWDLDSVIETIESAQSVEWDTDSFSGKVFGHQLAVLTVDGMAWRFDVRAPEKAGSSE